MALTSPSLGRGSTVLYQVLIHRQYCVCGRQYCRLQLPFGGAHSPALLCPANSTHFRHHTSDWPKIIASWSNMKVPEKLFLCTGSCAVSLLLQISFIVSEFRSILRGGILIFSPSHISIRGYFAVTVLSVFKAYPRTVFGPTALVALDSPACFLSLRFRRNHQTPAVR